MKKCNFRHCDSFLDPFIHGNSRYCAPEENIKKSCSYKEKLIRTRENFTRKNKVKEMMCRFDEAIKIQLKGKNEKQITFERFMELFENYLVLTSTKKINNSTVMFFENFVFMRITVNGIDMIKIEKS
jgi:hypothetical protein